MARTGNFSVRFDEEKLAFFKEKNPTLERPQQIVDFFLDDFYWRHKIGDAPKVQFQSTQKHDFGEPKENTMAFFNKYGCNTWEELKKLNK